MLKSSMAVGFKEEDSTALDWDFIDRRDRFFLRMERTFRQIERELSAMSIWRSSPRSFPSSRNLDRLVKEAKEAATSGEFALLTTRRKSRLTTRSRRPSSNSTQKCLLLSKSSSIPHEGPSCLSPVGKVARPQLNSFGLRRAPHRPTLF